MCAKRSKCLLAQIMLRAHHIYGPCLYRFDKYLRIVRDHVLHSLEQVRIPASDQLGPIAPKIWCLQEEHIRERLLAYFRDLQIVRHKNTLAELRVRTVSQDGAILQLDGRQLRSLWHRSIAVPKNVNGVIGLR